MIKCLVLNILTIQFSQVELLFGNHFLMTSKKDRLLVMGQCLIGFFISIEKNEADFKLTYFKCLLIFVNFWRSNKFIFINLCMVFNWKENN